MSKVLALGLDSYLFDLWAQIYELKKKKKMHTALSSIHS